MNKNVAIIEGDITKKFNPVSKVKVSNSDTGESTWIPEESKTTHSLSVIKNGIYYAASEGYTAYDTVTVNVSSETEVNYEGIIADMPDLADLGLYDLDDLEGLEGLDLDLDELQDLENLILDGDLEEGEIPTSGSTIKGIDPDSGETLEVGLDEDGNLMEQALPDHIHIVVYPRKRHYLEGEIIDFSGIHVYLMKKGTERFTCEQYPTGEIPFDELVFPVTVAESAEGTEYGYATSDSQTNWEQPIPLYRKVQRTHAIHESYVTADTKDTWFPNTDCVMIVRQSTDRDTYLYLIGKEEGVVGYYNYVWHNSISGDGERTDECISYNSITINGKTARYLGIASGAYNFSYDTHEPDVPLRSAPDDNTIWTAIYGNIELVGEDNVPVQWMRSDGEIMEDTFKITIGEGEDPDPEPDPYAGQCDFTWEGKKYCFNKSLARSEVLYSNGTVWQTWLGGQSPPYTVDQALKLKLIVQVGWSGGGSTSGDF